MRLNAPQRNWLGFGLILIGLVSGPLRASERVALVIGNSAYAAPFPGLKNPARDAQAVAQTLTKLGFEATVKSDLTKAAFDRALADFARSAAEADIALFYYAGHGVQYQGQNYFLGTDSTPKDNTDIEFETVAMSSVVRAASRARQAKIVIIDACRNSVRDAGQTSRRAGAIGDLSGLAAVEGSPGMIVFYSAEHGKSAFDGVGDNGPFARALIGRLSEPGLELKQVFTAVSRLVSEETSGAQQPEIVSAELNQDVFLNLDETAEQVWDKIHQSDDPAAFQEFVRRFSHSPRAADAKDKLEVLEYRRRASNSPPAKTPGPEAVKPATSLAHDNDPAPSPTQPADLSPAAKPVAKKAEAETTKDASATEGPEHGWLGVEIQRVTPDLAETLRARPNSGALVRKAPLDTPAAAAGLKPGDVIVAVNGIRVLGPRDFACRIAALPPHATAALGVVREGRLRRRYVTLGAIRGGACDVNASGGAKPGFDGELH